MTRSGSQAAHDGPDRHDATAYGQVLPFRRPDRGPPRVVTAAPATPEIKPIDEFADYEQDRDDQDDVVDYRQRMLMNVIALAVVTFLVTAGVWLADTIADMQRDQDCVMQGRANCAPLELPTPHQ